MTTEIRIAIHLNSRARRRAIDEVAQRMRDVANNLTLHQAVEAVEYTELEERTYTVGTAKTDQAVWDA